MDITTKALSNLANKFGEEQERLRERPLKGKGKSVGESRGLRPAHNLGVYGDREKERIRK